MLGLLNHVALAVKDPEKAEKISGAAFGADISAAVPLPEHGVITVFVTLPNTKIEFIQPLGEASPIAKFLERNADGGIHHICYDVPDIIAARDTLIREGARVLGDGVPKIGAHGKPVLFLHPKDFSGALVEIEQELARDALQDLNRLRDLLRVLVDRAVPDIAIRRAQPA